MILPKKLCTRRASPNYNLIVTVLGWFFLQDGVLLYLGETPKRKLRRYAKHKESLADNFTAVRAVDLRYSRGFSVDGDLRDREVI